MIPGHYRKYGHCGKDKKRERGKITCDTSPQSISKRNILTCILPGVFLFTYICEIKIFQYIQVCILFLKCPEHFQDYEKPYISIICKGCLVDHYMNAH